MNVSTEDLRATDPTAAQEVGFVVRAVDPERLARVRDAGADEYGNPLTPRTAEGWEPLRCCLRRATPAERIALICFTPWTGPSPWLEAGPIFVHLERCAGHRTPGEYPPDFAASPSMFNTFLVDGSRAYERIRYVAPGEDHTAALREVLAHPEVHHLHVRSATAGCFTFAVDRPTAQPRSAAAGRTSHSVHSGR